METEALTREQKEFLEECNLEFSERFTDSDLEYKKIFDADIPTPPIMSPWYGKSRFNNRERDRAGGSRYDNNYKNKNRDYHENNYRDRGQYRNDHQYRPY